jgi:hypothetical protein
MTEKEFDFVKQQLTIVARQITMTYHSKIYLDLKQGKQINLDDIHEAVKKQAEISVNNAINEIDALKKFGYTLDELTK